MRSTPIAPGLMQAVRRGVLARCPRCGGGGLFRRSLLMAPDCPRCGLHFERVDGYWLGSMALNFVVTEVVFVVSLVLLLSSTWPDVPWGRVLVVLIAVNVAVPLLFHPVSRTLWVAMERHFSREWE